MSSFKIPSPLDRCPSPAFTFTEIVPALKSRSSTEPTAPKSVLELARERDTYSPFQITKGDLPITNTDLPVLYRKVPEITVQNEIFMNALRFFKSLGVEVVSPKQKDLNPKKIRCTDVPEYYLLFCGIETGKSSIQFAKDGVFKRTCLKEIKKLLAIPSGRHLILSISRSVLPVVLTPSDTWKATERDGKIEVHMDFAPRYEVCIDKDGDRRIGKASVTSGLAHECIHVLHRLHLKRLQSNAGLKREKQAAREFYSIDTPPLRDYLNLRELFTIEGLRGENYLCEQTIRFELGEAGFKFLTHQSVF